MNGILRFWDGLVKSVAVIAIVVTALGLMVRAIDLGRGLKIIGSALAALVLLVMLPAILVGIWYSLSTQQQIGIAGLVALPVAVKLARIGTRGRQGSQH